MKQFTIDTRNAGQRLDKYCARILGLAPRSFIYKMLRKKNITLNGARAAGNEIVESGDMVRFFLSDATFDAFCSVKEEKANGIKPIEPERIVFENEDIIICYKNAGELSQKIKNDDVSINERILAYLKTSGAKSDAADFKSGVCNRLDRNTEGLIIAGKNPHATIVLSRMFRDHSIGKYYLAVVHGKFESEEMRVRLYLKKDEKSNLSLVSQVEKEGYAPTESIFYALKTGEEYSLVRIKLLTGKSHQIRAQLSFMGYPVAGDVKYGDRKDDAKLKKEFGIDHQLLLAHELIFPNEDFGLDGLSGMSVRAELPEKMQRIIDEVI